MRLWVKGEHGWGHRLFEDPEEELVLPHQGLRCLVGDLYENTHLRPRRTRGLMV